MALTNIMRVLQLDRLRRSGEEQASSDTLSSTSCSSEKEYLDGPRIFSCAECRTHLACYDEIISKSFHGRGGRAYLMDSLVNVRVGDSEDRLLITGLHTVADVYCMQCNSLLGWKYEEAFEAAQQYKVGKYVCEKVKLNKENWS